MAKLSFAKKILLVEALGFTIVIAFLWLNEIYDLPHKLLGAEATPVNFVESRMESLLVLVLALVVMGFTLVLARRWQQADQEKNRLFGVISHDLRSPFTNLIGNAELLRENFTTLNDEERRSLSSGIFEAAEKAHDLVENLLQWAEIQLERGAPAPQAVDLQQLVKGCIDHVGLAATTKQIVITNGVPAGTLVRVDPSAMAAVMRNLLSNAVKFSRAGGVIEVNAKSGGSKVRVTVADRGVGMSRAELKGLFRMGSRLSKPGTAGESGSGLGLLLCSQLIRRGGGKLKVRSEVGKGSTFQFALPRARGPVPSRPVAAKAEPAAEESTAE